MSRALTTLGLNRERYSLEEEPAPSRFTGDGAYTEWAKRADSTLNQLSIHSVKGAEDDRI